MRRGFNRNGGNEFILVPAQTMLRPRMVGISIGYEV